MTAYATTTELIATYRQTIDPAGDIADRLAQALEDGADQIDRLMGFDFRRHPTSGTESFIVDGQGTDRLCVHDGLVEGSVTKIEYRTSQTGDWIELDPEDWVLDDPMQEDFPVFHVLLTGASLGCWPVGRRLIRITGARGWATTPVSVKRANIDKARQIVGWEPIRPGGTPGPSELGNTAGPNRLPDSMWRLQSDFSGWELGIAQCDL